MLEVGQVLRKCQGQDITRRGAKLKTNRLMMVLPSQLAFKSANIEGTFGVIEKANTEHPELVIQTPKVRLNASIF